MRVARGEFAASGLAIPLSQVIEAAGLGRATFYRNFSSKEELLRSLYDDTLEKLREVRDASAPEDALFAIIRAAAPMHESAFPISSTLGRQASPEVRESIAGSVTDLVREPLRAAKAGGRVREDLSEDDIVVVFTMIGGAVVFRPGESALRHRDRALALVMDAICPRP